MPLVPCPKCTTNLRLPESSGGAVRCPKCQAVFQPPQAQPAFEVVEDAPPTPAPRPTPRPSPKPAEPEFDVVEDEPVRPSRRRVDDDDYDDRPRSRRRRDDDDDWDDRDDRRSRRRRDDDYDDDDDRPRSRRRRDEDDDWDDRRGRRDRDRDRRRDDYDDDYDRPNDKSGVGAAAIGLLLIAISLWVYLGTFALLALYLFIGWVGEAAIPNWVRVVTGILGIANWVLAMVGLGFCIAGPRRARGMAIAAMVVSAVHLIFGFVIANNHEFNPVWAYEINQAKAAEAEARKAAGDKGGRDFNFPSATERRRAFGGSSEMDWEELATQAHKLDLFLAALAYMSGAFGDYVLPLLGGIAELARIILILFTVAAVSRAVKAGDAAAKCKLGVIIVSVATGVCMLVFLLTWVIIDSNLGAAKRLQSDLIKNPPKSAAEAEQMFKKAQDAMESARKTMKNLKHYVFASMMLILLVHAGSLVLPGIAVQQAHSAVTRRMRR